MVVQRAVRDRGSVSRGLFVFCIFVCSHLCVSFSLAPALITTVVFIADSLCAFCLCVFTLMNRSFVLVSKINQQVMGFCY